MSAPQLTFLITAIFLSILLTRFFYPGVRRRADSVRDSLLASVMAATLCALPVAMLLAAVVNVIGAALA